MIICLIISSYLVFVGRAQQVKPEDFVPFDQRNGDVDGAATTLDPRQEDVAVRIGTTTIYGIEDTVKGVPWKPGRDPTAERPKMQGQLEPDPLPVLNDVIVYKFLGIPFAKPPVGPLRFKKPQVFTFPEDTYQARAFKPACKQNPKYRATIMPLDKYTEQFRRSTSENCLYLNVFTPAISRQIDNAFPVVIYFHGGNFQSGDSADWPAEYLASKGLVVVTVNYRLGPFGFLMYGDPDGSNYGLWDQLEATRWVQRYIQAFNGLPQDITIMGHGAGAVSVGLHMLSDEACDQNSVRQCNFQSAIALAGAEVGDLVIENPELGFNNTRGFATAAGCNTANLKDIFTCLSARSADDDLVQAAVDFPYSFSRYPFLPIVDHAFLKAPPRELLEDDRVVNKVPYLTGVNAQDGSEVLLQDHVQAFTSWQIGTNYFYLKAVDYVYQHNYTSQRQAVKQAIEYAYTYWPKIQNTDEVRQLYLDFATDAFYTSSVAESARLHATRGSHTWMYVNNYRLHQDRLNPVENEFFPNWLGVHHDTDAFLTFGFPWMPKEKLPVYLRLNDVTFTELDRNKSALFMEMVRQFVKRENPNLYQETDIWPAVNAQEGKLHYLNFNLTRTRGVNYRWQKVAFWTKYLKQLASLYTTTWSPTISALLWEHKVLQGVTGTFIVLFALFAFLTGVFGYLHFCPHRRKQHLSTQSHPQHHAIPVYQNETEFVKRPPPQVTTQQPMKQEFTNLAYANSPQTRSGLAMPTSVV